MPPASLCDFEKRFLLGAFNGTLAVSKALISDICGKEHEIIGMSVVSSEYLASHVSACHGTGTIAARPSFCKQITFVGEFSPIELCNMCISVDRKGDRIHAWKIIGKSRKIYAAY